MQRLTSVKHPATPPKPYHPLVLGLHLLLLPPALHWRFIVPSSSCCCCCCCWWCAPNELREQSAPVPFDHLSRIVEQNIEGED